MTLLLGRSDLEHLFAGDSPGRAGGAGGGAGGRPPQVTQLWAVRACLDALHAGFVAEPPDVAGQRVRTDLPGPGTATALLPGLLPGIPAYTVKVNAKFPDARPALRGLVCLHELATGELLAVLDSATVTAWRTGLGAALGTHTLARPDAAGVGVIGAGAQARLMIHGLRALRPVGAVVAYDIDESQAAGFPADVAGSPREVAERCDIVLLATWSRAPLLGLDDVRPGTQLTSLGVDEPGKVELAPDLLARARVVVDDLQLALIPYAESASTLPDVLRGTAPGRATETEITVYAPIGLPWQDLAVSWLAYRAALESGAGIGFDWLS